MKNALVYSCVLLLLSCGGKTGGTSQSSSTNQETQENALSEKTTAISKLSLWIFIKEVIGLFLIRFPNHC